MRRITAGPVLGRVFATERNVPCAADEIPIDRPGMGDLPKLPEGARDAGGDRDRRDRDRDRDPNPRNPRHFDRFEGGRKRASDPFTHKTVVRAY